MIIVQISNGLGNQLFQYAAARRLAIERNTPLKLDISAFRSDEQRTYRLSNYQICQDFISDEELRPFRSTSFRYRSPRVIERIFFPYYKRRNLYEKYRFRFDPNILHSCNHVYLHGYFQNEEYFKPIETLIRREFRLAATPTSYSLGISNRIKGTNSVSLHIRRGDYYSEPEFRYRYGVLPMSYYEAAIENIYRQVSEPNFFVFSDDVGWARSNLELSSPVEWIEGNGTDRDYEDLWLMSLCKHHIIANSSFSWWGAWLGSNPGKIVYAPAPWFQNHPFDSSGVVPSNWKRLPHHWDLPATETQSASDISLA